MRHEKRKDYTEEEKRREEVLTRANHIILL